MIRGARRLSVHASAAIERVSVRFGFFADRSFTVDDEDENEVEDDPSD